jgi:hypothetical protein
MSMTKRIMPVLAVLLFVGLIGLVRGQVEVSMSEIKFGKGQSVQPAFEGWMKNPDGSYSMWFGYLNRNYEEIPDIPVGPNNGFGAGGEDLGQPTHFLTRRQPWVFKVDVPADWAHAGPAAAAQRPLPAIPIRLPIRPLIQASSIRMRTRAAGPSA